MHFEDFLNVVVDPLDVQDDIILGSFSGIFVPRLVKLQLVNFLCWDKQPTFEEAKLGCEFSDLESQRLSHATFEFKTHVFTSTRFALKWWQNKQVERRRLNMLTMKSGWKTGEGSSI